jgi:uncharacterized membrane protein YbhN (UPF0104 family)
VIWRPLGAWVRVAVRRPLIRLLISALVLGLLFLKLPFADFLQAVRQVPLASWLLTVGLFLAGHAVGACKWRMLIRAGDPQFAFSHALRCHFTGLFANLFLPSIAGGDAVRLAMALTRTRHRGAVILASAADRFLDLASLALFAFGAAFLRPSVVADSHRRALAAAAVLLAVGALATTACLYLPSRKVISKRLGSPVRRLREAAERMTRMRARAAAGWSLALLVQAGFVLLNARLGSALGIAVPLATWFFAWPLAKLAATLPISLGGLGVREAALAALLSQHGVPTALAVAQGLAWQTILAMGSLVGGAVYVAGRRSYPARPRESPAEAP